MSRDEWNPYDLWKRELESQLHTTEGCQAARQFVLNLAHKLAVTGEQPSLADLQRLLELAYTSFVLNGTEAYLDELKERRCQKQVSNQELLDDLREVPPYVLPPIPDWLRDIQVPEVQHERS